VTSIWALALVMVAKPASFDALKADTSELDRPGNAVSAIIGICNQEDPVDRMHCQENTAEESKKHRGKTYYINLGANHQELLEFEGIRGSKARFLWVPIYDPGNGYALTAKKPNKVNKDGWPVLKKEVIDGALKGDVAASDLRRLARLGQVNIEIIGEFKKPWALRHGGDKVYGVHFKLKGLRLSQARSGDTILERLY